MSTMFLIAIVFLLVMVLLLLQNTSSVAVDFLIFNFNMPVGILILMSVCIGIIIALGVFSMIEEKYKRRIRAKNKKINKLKKEISKLNNEKFGEDVELDTQTSNLYDVFLKTLKEDEKFDVEYASTDINEEKQEEHIEEKKILSGFDGSSDEEFSIKAKSEKKQEKEVPWFSPLFKRNKTMEVVKKEEEKKDKLDDLISFDIKFEEKEDVKVGDKIFDEVTNVSDDTSDVVEIVDTAEVETEEVKFETKIEKVKEIDEAKNEESHRKKSAKKYNKVKGVSISSGDTEPKEEKVVFESKDLEVFEDYDVFRIKAMKLANEIQKDENVLKDMYMVDKYRKNTSENVLSVNDIRQKFNWTSEEKEDYSKYVIETKKRIGKLFSIDRDLRK